LRETRSPSPLLHDLSDGNEISTVRGSEWVSFPRGEVLLPSPSRYRERSDNLVTSINTEK
jgi:hypothetical protein